MSLTRYFMTINILLGALLACLFFFGDLDIYAMAYVSVFFFAVLRTLTTKASKRIRFYLVFAYIVIAAIQMIVCEGIVFATPHAGKSYWIRRLFGVVIMPLPLSVTRFLSVGRYSQFYLPSVSELATVSFSELRDGSANIVSAIAKIASIGKSLSADNIREVIEDLPRHDSFHYLNNGSLTDGYFAEAEKSMDDPNVYIIISNTGSAASEMISVFTQKVYNHASFSFDRGLKTIISYNGGENVYPPGLNHEMLDFFNKKPDASIIVYRLPCDVRQKRAILDKITEINREGSAYNMIGLVFKFSHKPNIMFCSQFVYNMLKTAGLTYFDKKDGTVKPTDLVEQDYYRKLFFDYEIKLNAERSS